jgi:hypothetical protein
VAPSDYEEIVIPSPPQTPRRNYAMAFDVAVNLAQWSATGMSDASRPAGNRYKAAAIPAAVANKAFTITSKLNLAPQFNGRAFSSRTEAAAALRTLSPAQSAQLQVTANTAQGDG